MVLMADFKWNAVFDLCFICFNTKNDSVYTIWYGGEMMASVWVWVFFLYQMDNTKKRQEIS